MRAPPLDRPRIYVDFNELVESDLVLLSKADSKPDSDGRAVELREGLEVHVYMDDPDEHGRPGALIADGAVEPNRAGRWTSEAKWSCRIDERGIRRWPPE